MWPKLAIVSIFSVLFFQAYISTVVGKIDHHNGTFWSLPVKINDGSATIDVDLSDQVLKFDWEIAFSVFFENLEVPY